VPLPKSRLNICGRLKQRFTASMALLLEVLNASNKQ
jgi:hypothetical protein